MPTIYRPVERIKQRHWWQTWLKPFYIFNSPFEQTLWIDADCVLIGDLDGAFEIIKHQPLIVRDGTGAVTQNHRSLYEHLPIPESAKWEDVSLNAGVVGLCKLRDRAILHAWGYGVAWAALNPTKEHLAAWADQGILLWAAHRLRKTGVIQEDLSWNFPALAMHSPSRPRPKGTRASCQKSKEAIREPKSFISLEIGSSRKC